MENLIKLTKEEIDWLVDEIYRHCVSGRGLSGDVGNFYFECTWADCGGYFIRELFLRLNDEFSRDVSTEDIKSMNYWLGGN